MTKEYQAAYRRRMHNEELERQVSGMVVEEKIEPSIEHQLTKRTYLQPIQLKVHPPKPSSSASFFQRSPDIVFLAPI